MTIELDQPVQPLAEAAIGVDQTVVLSGRLVSLRYLGAAVRRSKRVWILFAVAGLLIGLAFHVAVPRKYSAYSTVYLSHAIGSDDAVEIGNDLALLNNTAVARAAIKSLHEPSLNPDTFLGKTPGVAVSDNVIDIVMQGPSYQEAVRRVNAVTAAFLAFRAAEYTEQDQAIIKGLKGQMAALQAQVNSMTNTIDNGNVSSTQLTQLVAQRSSLASTISNLQQNVQTDQLNTDAIVQATRVLTSGTAEYHSSARLFAIDGLSGLGAGLVIGLGLVVLAAMTSDRVRRREDLATIIGANVEVSVGARPQSRQRSGGRTDRHGSRVRGLRPSDQLAPVASYFEHLITAGARPHLLVVAVDDVDQAAAAAVQTATALAAQEKKVVIVDFTSDRVLEGRFRHLFHRKEGPVQRVQVAPQIAITLFVASRTLGPEDDRSAWELSPERWQRSDVVIALGTIDLGRGAWHLRNWDQAILTVTAGRSTPQRIGGTAELLRASGVSVVGSVLFNADPDDESVGLVPATRYWTSDTVAALAANPPIRR